MRWDFGPSGPSRHDAVSDTVARTGADAGSETRWNRFERIGPAARQRQSVNELDGKATLRPSRALVAFRTRASSVEVRCRE